MGDNLWSKVQSWGHPLARREAPAEGLRPDGANIDRRLVPYHGKSMRIQSQIEFIYIYLSIYASTMVLFLTVCEGWVLGKRLRKAITKVQKAESS